MRDSGGNGTQFRERLGAGHVPAAAAADFAKDLRDGALKRGGVVRGAIRVDLGGEGVPLVHGHANDIHRDAAGDDFRREAFHQLRVARFAVGDHEQAEGAVAKLFRALLEQAVGAFLQIRAQRSAAVRLDGINHLRQAGLVARAERIDPIVFQIFRAENQQADVRVFRHGLEDLLQRRFRGGHLVHARSPQGLGHRAGGVEHDHHVVGDVLGEAAAVNEGNQRDAH